MQVAWIKLAEKQPGPTFGAFPLHSDALEADLETTLHNLIALYPNLRLAFLSSRTRAYTNVFTALNPEPFAYESGIAVRELIERQVAGDPALAYALPGPQSPWLAWGPYLWADGTTPRSDGFFWDCTDTQPDFTHPSVFGVQKVADQLLAFFKTDSTSTPWFLRPGVIGSPPSVQVYPSSSTFAAPAGTAIITSASDPGGGSSTPPGTSATAATSALLDRQDLPRARPVRGALHGHRQLRQHADDRAHALGAAARLDAVDRPRVGARRHHRQAGPGRQRHAGRRLARRPAPVRRAAARAGRDRDRLHLDQRALHGRHAGASPDVLLFGFTSNALGLLNLTGTWPTGIPLWHPDLVPGVDHRPGRAAGLLGDQRPARDDALIAPL